MRELIRQLVRECILLEKKRLHRKKPGGELTRMGALKKLNPNQFKSAVQQAMAGAQGDVDVAADKIDVSPRRMYDYLNEPGFEKIETDVEREQKEKKEKK